MIKLSFLGNNIRMYFHNDFNDSKKYKGLLQPKICIMLDDNKQHINMLMIFYTFLILWSSSWELKYS